MHKITNKLANGREYIDEIYGQKNDVKPKIMDRTNPILFDLNSSLPNVNITRQIVAITIEFTKNGTMYNGSNSHVNASR